jgi:hypothetical protein
MIIMARPRGLVRNRRAVEVRYHSRCIVRRRTDSRRCGAIKIPARRANKRSRALHLLPHLRTGSDAVCVRLYPHRLGVEVSKKDLNLKVIV